MTVYSIGGWGRNNYRQFLDRSRGRGYHRAMEGVSTLSPEFTRQYLLKTLQSIAKLREGGMTEVAIMAKLKADLKAYDGHTIRRLHEMSLGTPMVDDFGESILKGSKLLSDGSMELNVTEAPQEVAVGSLVQFRGDPWCVSKIDRKTVFTLKRIR